MTEQEVYAVLEVYPECWHVFQQMPIPHAAQAMGKRWPLCAENFVTAGTPPDRRAALPESCIKSIMSAKYFWRPSTGGDPAGCSCVSCTLNEDVDPDRLNQALEQTARENPQFQVTLHRGLFWHYFEHPT